MDHFLGQKRNKVSGERGRYGETCPRAGHLEDGSLISASVQEAPSSWAHTRPPRPPARHSCPNPLLLGPQLASALHLGTANELQGTHPREEDLNTNGWFGLGTRPCREREWAGGTGRGALLSRESSLLLDSSGSQLRTLAQGVAECCPQGALSSGRAPSKGSRVLAASSLGY